MQYEYEWDHNKAHSNLRKHSIQFADAVSVFNDNFAIIISDDHPDEERFIIIGLDLFRRILVIAYTYRDQNTIRIISARKANKIERQQYEGQIMKEQYDFSTGKRGAIDPIPQGKTQITLYLDDEIINWFRETVNAQNGGNYQTLINQALQDYIEQKGESLESLLRRILREELTTSK